MKSAYRKLALKYHPDRNPGDTTAEENVQGVRRGLRRARRRRTSGRPTTASATPPSSSAGSARRRPHDLRGLRRHPRRPRRHLRLRRHPRRRPAARRPAARRRSALRPRNHVRGIGQGHRDEHPDSAAGSLRNVQRHRALRRAPRPLSATSAGARDRCGSSRASSRSPARARSAAEPAARSPSRARRAAARASVPKQRKITVKIPAGIATGQQLRLQGEGEGGTGGAPAGNLYVVIHVQEHEFFRRDGLNLFCEIPVNFTTVALGGEIQVPTLDGTEAIKVPEGTETGTTLRLRGKGMPDVNGRGKGDLFATVQVRTPKKLTKDQRHALEQLAEDAAGRKVRAAQAARRAGRAQPVRSRQGHVWISAGRRSTSIGDSQPTERGLLLSSRRRLRAHGRRGTRRRPPLLLRELRRRATSAGRRAPRHAFASHPSTSTTKTGHADRRKT